MKIGDRVRVHTSIQVFHHPQHKGKPFDLKDLTGEIVGMVEDKKGRPISPNYPLMVKLGEKFTVHLSEQELELLE
ncbi:MAG: ferredoxin-thioredoxin reductase variable chain [Pseudanabaenaceae cyanobacterium bins.68]|nr:ferredoxin-thioredoxin reductase variable chain [Pseudanabaenaceae cyanobacterium bins.68]